MLMHNPPHPGEVIRELCQEPLGLSVTAAAEALGVSRKIVVSDISEKMLNIARTRISKSSCPHVEIKLVDACSMPEIESESVELFSMSLGLKICERTSVLKEAFRVLKPSGKLVVLEASNIPVKIIHRLYLKYMAFVMPIIGWLATNGDASAYKYLLRGVESFPSRWGRVLHLTSADLSTRRCWTLQEQDHAPGFC